MVVRSSHLGAGGVDPDGVVQLLLGEATLDGHAVALRHLAGVGPQVVEPDDPVLERRRSAPPGNRLTTHAQINTYLYW